MSEKEVGTPEQLEMRMHRLLRNSRAWEILTFVMVLIVSPLSFLFGLPLGIDPTVWLGFWLHWTFVFILLAIALAAIGLNAASTSWLEAERIRGQLKK